VDDVYSNERTLFLDRCNLFARYVLRIGTSYLVEINGMMKPHKLPRQEDVTEINLGNNKVVIAKTTDESKDYLVELALSMYLGEKCKYCLREFKTLDDLNDTVYAGDHEHGRLACESCWDANNVTP